MAISLESSRVIALGALVGLGLGAMLGVWQLVEGAQVATALLWALGGLVAALVLAGVSALGIRLQRKDLPPPT